jgi:hypothetical protein
MVKTYSPEATLVACGVVQQSKGDLAAARRAVGEAHEWLCSIDPSYRAPVAAAPLDDGKLRETQGKLAAALEAHQAALRDVRALEAKVRDLEAKVAKAAAPAPVRVGGAATYAEQTAKPAADPFAHLPPAMREYARRAAAGATLDID